MDRDDYRKMRQAEIEVEARVKEAIAEAIRDTPWDVPDGILNSVLVVLTFVDSDGDYMTVWNNWGAWTTAEGMARRVIRDIKYADRARHRAIMGDDDGEVG